MLPFSVISALKLMFTFTILFSFSSVSTVPIVEQFPSINILQVTYTVLRLHKISLPSFPILSPIYIYRSLMGNERDFHTQLFHSTVLRIALLAYRDARMLLQAFFCFVCLCQMILLATTCNYISLTVECKSN